VLYSGIVSFGFAMAALALGFVGWIPGAAGLVNVALLLSVVFFLAAGFRTLGHRHLPFFHRRRANRR
jgi:hypothetical protein